MKIRRLLIQNFKGIQRVHMTDLQDVITIAGKNGCGKTCLLEGIRLLKSQYGHYSENENQAWWNEKQVDLRYAGAARNVLRDSRKSAIVEAEIELTDSEKQYVREDPRHLTEVMAIRAIAPGIENQIEYRLRGWALENWRAIPTLSQHSNEILERTHKIKEAIEISLASKTTTGRFDIHSDGRMAVQSNDLLTFIFGTFDPRRLGIIEFNPADRRYPPERFTNVTVDVEQQDEAWKQSAMYNTEAKYGGIKEALGNEWIRGIIRREAGDETETQEMALAMQEIFRDMIPDKEFGGPRPTVEGRLEFIVTTGGNEHDIDDLSSGEKEILFGYLKTRVRAPKNSVIIVDEPELHLNPRMIAGLPGLYERHIGKALQNQVWLVTHSDVFLRRAFEAGGMQVFHMDMPRDTEPHFNQIMSVGSEERFERACLELIGDFATFEPQGRILLVEGGSKFDEEMVNRLFAAELRGVNVASVASKNEVLRKKKELLDLQEIQGIKREVVAVTDGDGVDRKHKASKESQGEFSWELYDIEAYLLEPNYVQRAVDQISMRQIPQSRIESVLENCAREVMQEMISSKLVGSVRDMFQKEIRQNIKRSEPGQSMDSIDLGNLVKGAIRASERISEVANQITIEDLERQLRELNQENERRSTWEAREWKKVVPGKRVLMKTAETLVGTGTYVQLRNVIIGLMAADGYKPAGMGMVIRKAIEYERGDGTW